MLSDEDEAPPPHWRLCLLLDRAEEAAELQELVEGLPKSPSRFAVVLMSGSDDDDVVRFVDRVRQLDGQAWLHGLDLEDWLEDEDVEPQVQISPPRHRMLEPQVVPPAKRAGLLTRWARNEFGTKFSDDAAVLRQLAEEPRFFVISMMEERSAKPRGDLETHLGRLRADIASSAFDRGRCPGVLLFVWVQATGKQNADIERMSKMKALFADGRIACINAFSKVQPPHLEAWWPRVAKARRYFNSAFRPEPLLYRLKEDMFEKDVEVPMRRAVSTVIRCLDDYVDGAR